jgi:transcriptional regulator with XRE-family HTH domain
MNSTQERLAFSERLQQALSSAEYSPSSPTQLAREFNIRSDGNPVTVHAARKWLQGESIPTQEKLRTLANWLDVPADWLRFGIVEDGKGSGAAPASVDAKIIAQLQQLDEHHLTIAHELLRALVKTYKKR